MSAEFFQGRPTGDLLIHLSQSPIPDVQDLAFGTTRLRDHRLTQLHSANFKHCTFANISLLDARLDSFNFVDCVFLSCYFRRSDLRNCTFVGCRFIDCAFPKTQLKMADCGFDHSTFVRCFVPLLPGRYNLPRKEHNLRAELATNWAIEAEIAGATREAR
ncbi:MAG TPA: pentapeptide repeat-containing protein, partial [Baekduia sp.]